MAPTARDEMDTLLDLLLTVSQELLAEHGEFYPHAASIDSDGEPAMAGAHLGEEHPSSGDVLEALTDGLRSQVAGGEIRASGMAVDVRVTPPGEVDPSDAIRVALEHAEADPVYVFLPYSKSANDGLEYGDLFAAPGERVVFTAA